MKRILTAACAALLALVTFGAANEGSAKSGVRTFVVGFDADFKPYGYKEGEEYRGFDLDLAREICKRRGWQFVANPINWDSKDVELNSGSIDCIWNGFTMQGRENAYTWSRPYVDNSQVVMVKVGATIQKLTDLKGHRVGVQTDTPVWKALKAGGEQEALGNTFKELVVMPNYNQAVQELEMGGVDAVALDVGVARAKMADKPNAFRLLDEVVMSETYGIGFKRGNTALRDEIEAELAILATDGTMEKLAEEYGIEKKSLIFTKSSVNDAANAATAQENALAFKDMIKDLLSGLFVSLEIFFLTLLVSLPLGFVVAFGRMAKNPVVSAIFQAYISIVRGTPLMLQILFVYFAPYILFGASLARYPRLLATVLAFSLNYAAYFAEIYRGGILSIDFGQREAAKALGLGPVQTFFRIILPQTIKRVIPAVGNEVITLVKDTSLAFTIAVTEMFTIARQLSSAHTTMAPLIAAGVFYYLFNFVVAWTLSRVEKHYDYYR